MPDYVHGCPQNREHPRQEIVHGMKEDPIITCTVCKSVMQRIPQPFRFALSAFEILGDWSKENLRRYKLRKRGYNVPRFSPDHVNRPDPRGGKDSKFR